MSDPSLKSMINHLSRPLGSTLAAELGESLGLKGLEAIEAMLLAVNSQNESLIAWVYDGVKTGRLGEGAPPDTPAKAIACAMREAIERKPDALLALLRLGAQEPGLMMRAREAVLARYSGERSFLALMIKECVLPQVTGPGKATRGHQPSDLALQTAELCSAFWDSLSPPETLMVAPDELGGLTQAVSGASYETRQKAMAAGLASSKIHTDKAALELAAAPALRRPGRATL